MGKKELKRLLKLCEQDNNSLADESIYYRERAEKDEEMCNWLIEVGTKLISRDLVFVQDYNRLSCNWRVAISEWRANPPKNYREAAQ